MSIGESKDPPRGRGGIGAFCLDFARRAAQGGIGTAVLFVPFALLAFVFTFEWAWLAAVPLAGGFIGLLIGGGSTFEAWFSPASKSGAGESPPMSMAEFYSRIMEPGWLRLLRGLHSIVTHDYSKGQPGRLRRAAVGAAAGALLGLLICGVLSQTFPHASPPVFVPVAFVAVPAAFGAAVGALSDSM